MPDTVRNNEIEHVPRLNASQSINTSHDGYKLGTTILPQRACPLPQRRFMLAAEGKSMTKDDVHFDLPMLV